MNTHSCVRLIDVLMLIIAVAIGAAFFVGVLPARREAIRTTICATNLRAYGSAMWVYANDGQVFPMATGPHRAGEMTAFAHRNLPPDPEGVPSPTADMWMMVHINYATPKQMNCPSSEDTPDPIQDTTTVFDFVGPNHLSYAYIYQYHPGRKPVGPSSNPHIPLMTDANPYMKGGVRPDVAADRESTGRGNSRNHRPRRGQNIVWVDGHVSFARTPWHGAANGHTPYYEPHSADNIFTTHADNEPSDPGNAPTWTRIQIGSKSDYCLVP